MSRDAQDPPLPPDVSVASGQSDRDALQEQSSPGRTDVQGPVGVLIVDDHASTRAGLRLFLMAYPGLKVLGEVANGEEALAFCAQTRPDVILMDMRMEGMDGIATAGMILSRHPDVRVIVLTAFEDSANVRRALETGVSGYLLKDVSASELAEAIQAVAAGQIRLAPAILDIMVQMLRQPVPPHYDLTQREREVLGLMLQGLSNGAIAENLGVSLATIKFHATSIYAKLGVSSRAEAIVLAHQIMTS
jgi:two-component system, NarL family, response regulator LiaR